MEKDPGNAKHTRTEPEYWLGCSEGEKSSLLNKIKARQDELLAQTDPSSDPFLASILKGLTTKKPETP